jgi:Na+-driven multidrug efflux pump
VAATGITIAEAHGARRHDSMPGILRHGILLSLSVVVVAIGGMLCFYQFLPDLPWYPYLGQAPRIVEMAEGYLYYYSAGFVVLLVGGATVALASRSTGPGCRWVCWPAQLR